MTYEYNNTTNSVNYWASYPPYYFRIINEYIGTVLITLNASLKEYVTSRCMTPSNFMD